MKKEREILPSKPTDCQNKTIPENAAELTVPPNTPRICTKCERLDIAEIMDEPVPGCLDTTSGEYTDGWKRLSVDLVKCLWN
ncbi:MAG: hypothetical protein HGA69_00390 [Desulfobulbaceae bacterium]|nr:hypothetical protein [Desulfobulbaceae bacterium]